MTEVLMQLKNLHCISGTAGRVDVAVVCSKLLDEMKKKLNYGWKIIGTNV